MPNSAKAPDATGTVADKSKDDGMPQEKLKFGDDVFKIPPYPGAKVMPYTSLEMPSDGTTSYHRKYTSTDDFDKIGTYLETEAAKVGKIEKTPMDKGTDMKRVFVALDGGARLQFEAFHNKKDNNVIISAHYIGGKK